MPIYYRNKKTRKIEAKYVDCDTQSSLFRNRELYERFVSDQDLPLEVTPVPTPAPAPAAAPPAKKKPWYKFW